MAAFFSWNILSMDCRCFRCDVDGAIALFAFESPLVLVVAFVRFDPSTGDELEGLRLHGTPWYNELAEDGVGELLPAENAGPV
jgi:hypothetical protein